MSGPAPHRSSRGSGPPGLGRRGLLALGPALAALLLAAGWRPGEVTAQEGPNQFERADIEDEAVRAFQHMITLWREELYFELYEEGWADSKARLGVEEFAQRMVELTWVPEREPDPKFLKPDFRHRTMVYVNSRLRFRNKFNPTQSFEKDLSTLLLKEGGRWRIDLVQIIRAPYS